MKRKIKINIRGQSTQSQTKQNNNLIQELRSKRKLIEIPSPRLEVTGVACNTVRKSIKASLGGNFSAFTF